MATPENTYIQSIHRWLPVDLYRMKNHNQYNGGIADVWYSGTKADLWIEYKFTVLPKRDSTLVVPDLSPLQVDWLTKRSKEGRRVGVIIGSKEGGVWLPDTTWLEPMAAGDFRKLMMPRSELAEVITKIVCL